MLATAPTPYVLPGELTIYKIAETRDALLAWVTEHATKGHDYLEISARDVEEVDGSGLQLLASISNMDQSWRLVEASDRFVDACRAMGLTQWLDSRYLKNINGASS